LDEHAYLLVKSTPFTSTRLQFHELM
jgi:hypothetical protein